MKKSYKQFIASLAIVALGILSLILVKAYYPEGYDLARVLVCFIWGYSVWAMMSREDRKKFLADGPDTSKLAKIIIIIMIILVVIINVFNLGGA
jgi:hypothetical protein